MRLRRALIAAIAALASTAVATPSAGAAPALRAGVGRADITPPQTGYYLGGWTRADRLAQGQSTRLYANMLFLQRGSRRVALVAAELFGIPAGLQRDVAAKLSDLGIDERSLILAASHTHSAPGGFANDPTYNTAAPSVNTISDPLSFERLLDPKPADKQLYTFLVDQIAAAVRRAAADRAPAVAGWGHTTLTGLTMNRSIEAHLANHGIHERPGTGSAKQDPLGVNDTIDPNVDVLRVDKLVRHKGRTRREPIGGWSNFADHGTVVKSELEGLQRRPPRRRGACVRGTRAACGACAEGPGSC